MELIFSRALQKRFCENWYRHTVGWISALWLQGVLGSSWKQTFCWSCKWISLLPAGSDSNWSRISFCFSCNIHWRNVYQEGSYHSFHLRKCTHNIVFDRFSCFLPSERCLNKDRTVMSKAFAWHHIEGISMHRNGQGPQASRPLSTLDGSCHSRPTRIMFKRHIPPFCWWPYPLE